MTSDDSRLHPPSTDHSRDDQESTGRVVVGVGGSTSSLAALRRAADIARSKHWSIDIVTAWPDADEVFIHDVPGRYMVARGRAMGVLREALDAIGDVPDAVVSTFLVNARPTQALLSRCAGADLLVVGAGRPADERNRAAVGSECLVRSSCPVIQVVKPDPACAVSTPGLALAG